jgi:hypothetical protein
VLSGVIGFGLGDIALYFALPRIGSRLTLLLTQCLAAPLAALAEWLWLGTALPPANCSRAQACSPRLAGVGPEDNLPLPRRTFWSGTGFGVLAALGQALGAVVSRHAFELSLASGVRIDGGTAAFQRILGGVVCSGVAWWFWRNRDGERSWPTLRTQFPHGRSGESCWPRRCSAPSSAWAATNGRWRQPRVASCCRSSRSAPSPSSR